MSIRASFLILVVAAALTNGCAARRSAPAARPISPTADIEMRDTHERLHGVLWMQTAAEFWTLSQSAFERAGNNLDRALADKNWTAALEQEGSFSNLPPAVIMDLDETVLDNSQFQGQLVLDRTDYLPTTWTEWVNKASAPAIPGAVEFIKLARSKEVRVIFVTNRTAAEEAKTVQNLDALLGSTTDPNDVLCSGENQWPSDKAARRKYVAEKYRILLLVGDDLNDFVSVSSATSPADRLVLAKTNAPRWRDRWVLVPNPLYGSWERILYQKLTMDPEILKKKRDTVRGFKN
jgi:acid phosphatase